VSDDPQPWWIRALEPLRSEDAMFRVLLVVIAVVGVLIGLVVLVRAL
jgi:hypothetical protein